MFRYVMRLVRGANVDNNLIHWSPFSTNDSHFKRGASNIVVLARYLSDCNSLSQAGKKLEINHVHIKENSSLATCSENNDLFNEKTPLPELFESVDFKEIAGDDEDALKRLKLLLLEVDVMRQDGGKVPKEMSTDQLKELFTLKTRSQRIKMLRFWWLNEIKKLSDERKKDKRKLLNIERRDKEDKENENNDHIVYGFNGSTIFLRIYETTINSFYNSNLIQSMQFGQNLVIDCGYNAEMTSMENKLCSKQLALLFADNRVEREPFNISFCNMKKSDMLYKNLERLMPTMGNSEFPMIIKQESYLDVFPKEKLVYLTPHCRNELLNFNYDDIYIIGALVDRHNTDPLSLAKAKSEGIRMASLPLDSYLQWNLGTKSLTLNQVLKILLDIKRTGDWNIALKNVPRRKIRQPDEPVQDHRRFKRRGTFDRPSKSDRFY